MYVAKTHKASRKFHDIAIKKISRFCLITHQNVLQFLSFLIIYIWYNHNIVRKSFRMWKLNFLFCYSSFNNCQNEACRPFVAIENGKGAQV